MFKNLSNNISNLVKTEFNKIIYSENLKIFYQRIKIFIFNNNIFRLIVSKNKRYNTINIFTQY